MTEQLMLKVGDVIELREKYQHGYSIGTVIKINEFYHGGQYGWFSRDIVVLCNNGMIIRITESCIQNIIASD
jgi:hypothetical protein